MSASDFMAIFKDLFTDSFARGPKLLQDRHCFTLTEHAPEASLKKVQIDSVPENSILLKMQKYPAPDRVFKSTKDECKRCDYILITSYGKSLYFFFIEMKSKKPDNRDSIPQIIGGHCFMEYCCAIVKHFHGPDIADCRLQKRNVVLHKAHHCNKKTTHPRAGRHIHSSTTYPFRERIAFIGCPTDKGNTSLGFNRLISESFCNV